MSGVLWHLKCIKISYIWLENKVGQVRFLLVIGDDHKIWYSFNKKQTKI